ncbi:MAG: hypothetical protein IPJ69_13445 [Deltaproteobacteria bacterium]|nr:MAG: hypothetical protein IPJ69_13445 [Deltaproteobacteria bacterium]
MNLTNTKKIMMGLVVGITFLTSLNAFCNESKEGFIPQMMEQVKGNGFSLTDTRSNVGLEIGGSKLSSGPKVLVTFRFGA